MQVVSKEVRFSIALVAPSDVVVGHGLLAKLLRQGMVAPAEPLRVPIDEHLLLGLLQVDATTTWTVCFPMLLQLLISVELCLDKLGQDVGVVGAVQVTSYERHWLSRIWVSPCRRKSDLDVLEDTIAVQVHCLDELS